MRVPAILALFLTVALPAPGQTAPAATAGLPSDPRAVFASAAPFYNFTSPELKPWHLKASYQFYDAKGNPQEQGIFEYWWASPKVYRSSWTRPGVNASDWSTDEGARLRKASGNPQRYFERKLNTILFTPLPSQALLSSGRIKLDLKMVPAGSGKLACVSSALQWEQGGNLVASSSAVQDLYCFDPSLLALRMEYSNTLTTEFSHIVKTQGRYLPRSIVVSAGKRKIFAVSVEAIEGISPDDTALVPPADAILEHEPPSRQSEGSDGGVIEGVLVKKTQPVYPLMAKMAHEQGIVILDAVIGTDGRIHDLEVVASPSPLLADAAVDAVKRWEYKPHLLSGSPVEVETTINVTFALGQ